MSTSTDRLAALKAALAKSVLKPGRRDGRANTSSAVVTESSAYLAGSVASDSGILDCPSEEVALAMSVHASDFAVTEVVTLSSVTPADVSPVVLKILADHAAKIGRDFRYTVLSEEGGELFSASARGSLPFYSPPSSPLAKASAAPVSCTTRYEGSEEGVPSALKAAAIQGIERNFPNYDSASGYGASVITEDGTIYFGGQYSTPEKRLGMHAEMGVMAAGAMSLGSPVRAMGLVSSKHESAPCTMCGACRQFVIELCEKAGIEPVFYCFAKSTDEYRTYRLADLLPDAWSSKPA